MKTFVEIEPSEKIPQQYMYRQHMYRTISELLERGVVRSSERVLVVCGGPSDAHILGGLGFTRVTVTSLADHPRSPIPGFRAEDVQSLTFTDDSFDTVLVHAGLHHCSLPHRGLAEMYRVARRNVVVFESQDSLVVRLLVHLGFTIDYELDAVISGCGGGVDNGSVPNYIFRWTRREVEKTVRSLDAAHEPVIEYFSEFYFDSSHFGDFMGRHALTQVLGRERVGSLMNGGVRILNALLRSQGNKFAFVIRKDCRRLHTWLRKTERG